jgi:DNA mismatch repair protein MutS2
MFLVTTHQSSLKTYALQKEHIVNDSLEFDPTTLRPTYKFLSGIPGNSYAFALAERLGVQDDVLAFAQQYRSETQTVMEDTISVLLQYRNEAEQLKEAAVKAESIAQKKKAEFEAKLTDLKQRQNELIRSSKQEASEILSKANSIIENTIREVREQQKTPAEIKKEFDKSKKEVVASIEETPQQTLEGESHTFEAGDAVRLDNASEIGTVIFVEQDQQHSIVEFNSLKFRVKTSQLQLVSKKEQKVAKKTSQSVGGYANKFDSKVTIDLRGKRVEEAIFELENAISDALLSNLPFMYILHGKGTGALRIAIQQFLKKERNIVSFREGELNEGGAGVTVVTF